MHKDKTKVLLIKFHFTGDSSIEIYTGYIPYQNGSLNPSWEPELRSMYITSYYVMYLYMSAVTIYTQCWGLCI